MGADEALAPTTQPPPHIRWSILAASKDLDIVAEAIACLASGVLIVGVDLADAFVVAGDRSLSTSHGRAILIEGLAGANSCLSSTKTLEELSAAGYDGGLILIQSIARQDDAEFDLAEFDAMKARFLEDKGQRPQIATAYSKASTTSLVMIAFKKPSSAAELDP